MYLCAVNAERNLLYMSVQNVYGKEKGFYVKNAVKRMTAGKICCLMYAILRGWGSAVTAAAKFIRISFCLILKNNSVINQLEKRL